MKNDITKYVKTVSYLFLIFVKMGFTADSIDGKETNDIKLKTTVLPKIRKDGLSTSSRFIIFPNTTWKNASTVCLNLSARLLLAYDSDFIKQRILPMLKSRDFVWVSVKDYGLNCKINTGLDNDTTSTVCDSYARVNMKPTAEKLNYGLCEKRRGIQRQQSLDPLTWNEMKTLCTKDSGQLYKFSTIEEGRTLLSIIRPNQRFWTRKAGNKDFPEFSTGSEIVPVCIGLVKLTDSYIYMADDCNKKHNFICDFSPPEYAPAVEALDEAPPYYVTEEVERAMTRAVIKPTPTNYMDGSTEGVGDTVADSKPVKTEQSTNVGAIVGPVVAAVFVIFIGVVSFYCYVRVRKAKAYRRSLFRYETKKSSLNTPKLRCHDITHLTLHEREASAYNDEPQEQEREQDDVYYERRYEPLQREVVDACTKKLKQKKGGLTEEQLNQLMNYDPLRTDSFLSSGHDSNFSDGVTISYEKYDPDSDEGLQQHTLPVASPKRCNPKTGNVSYLKQVRTLDDLDQYENSNSLQEAKLQVLDDICKLQKDSENEVKKLEDLDQYENYNLPPLKALPTKTRPKKASNNRPSAPSKTVPRRDCYENHDI